MSATTFARYRRVLQLDPVAKSIFQIQTKTPETAIYHRAMNGKKLSLLEREWLAKEAGAGNYHAMETLGAQLLGEEGNELRQQGLNWIRKAAEMGSPPAQVILGEHLLDGDRVPAHPGKGQWWLHNAAQNGNRRARISLALRMIEGDSIDGDQKRGQEMLRALAEEGSLVACAILAAHCLEQSAPSFSEAFFWLEIAGAASSEEMVKTAIFLYLDALTASTKTQEKRLVRYAGVLLRSLAERGAPGAAANLAYLLRRGELPSGSFPELAEIQDPLIAAGDSFVLMNQALRLAAGVDCASDWVAADSIVSRLRDTQPVLNWWRARADAGDAEGHLVIAWLLRSKLQNDPDGLGLDARADLAQERGWSIPEWFVLPPGNEKYS